MLWSSLVSERKGRREGEDLQKSGCKKPAWFQGAEAPGQEDIYNEIVRFTQSEFCTCLYLYVGNGDITAECSAEGWVGKVTAEEVMAPPLPRKGDVELTPMSYQMKESVYGLA